MEPLPAERFGSAIRAGFRHARNNPPLRATLIRARGFFLFAGTYWALLPLIARDQIAGGGPGLYGFLLGSHWRGGRCRCFCLALAEGEVGTRSARRRGNDRYGNSDGVVWRGQPPSNGLCRKHSRRHVLDRGIGYLNVSAQVALPDWVRGRGLAIFVTTFFGALSLAARSGGRSPK